MPAGPVCWWSLVASPAPHATADIYKSDEVRRIAQHEKPQERGEIPEHAQIRHKEVVEGGMKVNAKRPETEDAQDIWRQNRNPGLKWWCVPPAPMPFS